MIDLMEYFCAAGKRQFLCNSDFFVWGTDIRGLMRGLTTRQGNREPVVVSNKVGSRG